MQCRDRPGGRLMTEFSTEDGSLTLGATDGSILLQKSAEDTDWPGWQHGHYDLVLTDVDDLVFPLLVGTYNVIEPVTV